MIHLQSYHRQPLVTFHVGHNHYIYYCLQHFSPATNVKECRLKSQGYIEEHERAVAYGHFTSNFQLF